MTRRAKYRVPASIRIVHLLLLLALAGSAGAGLSGPTVGAPARVVGGPETKDPDELGQALRDFGTTLNQLRGGDDSVIEGLRLVSRRLCERFGRCDAVDVFEFYAGLPPEARVQGFEDELAYRKVHKFAWGLSKDGLPEGESWPELCDEICDELRELIEASGSHQDFTPVANAHSLLADLLFSSDSGSPERLERVHFHASQAIELFDRAGQLTPQLNPLWTLGRIFRARGEATESRRIFERCAELAHRLGRPEYVERALLGRIELAKDVGDWREVDRLLEQLAEIRGPDESWPLAREHATRLVNLDQPEAALRFLLNYPPEAASYDAEWHTMLSSVFLRSGDLAAARREMMELGETDEELRELSWASLDLAREQYTAVQNRLEPFALGEGERRSAFDTWSPHSKVQAWSFLGEAMLALGQPRPALEWLELAVGGADEWEGARAEDSGSVVGEWLGLHVIVLLARTRAELGEPLEAARVIEDFQSRRMRSNGKGLAPADRRVTRRLLLDWSARFEGGLVTWVVGAESGIVAHVDPSGESVVVPLIHGRRAVQTAVRRLREAVVGGQRGRALDLAEQISSVLLPAEITTRLSGYPKGTRTLLLPHGPLEALPVGLLQIGDRLLDEQLTPIVLPGLPLSTAPALHSKAEWTLLGNPLDSQAPAGIRLPGAARELAGLRRLYPRAKSFTGASFNRGAVLDALRSDAPLHIATHLLHDARCEGSEMAAVGLELSGGDVLCAREIELIAPRLPLVVLTACETAGGRFIDGEGMHGISRAFLESGSTRLVTTLWPVEDSAAERFGQLLHARLRNGAEPARATALAREEMRASGAEPVDWAAFRYTGSD